MYTMIAGVTPALSYTRQFLREAGIPVTDSFRWDVKHLLLDVPSFRPGGLDPDTVLASLPKDIIIWGGNLNHTSLKGYRCIDLLKDEQYLTANAAITADCTLHLITTMAASPWSGSRILVIGWGRIGKCLADKLQELGCCVTVTARSLSDRSLLNQLGFQSMDTECMSDRLSGFDMIINTVPAPVLKESDLLECSSCLKIDLASKKGIAGDDVVWARGLPGKYAPERSGRLIADTVLRIRKEEFQ